MVASRIVSKKMIKPSSPTPPSLRCHNLSLMDCLNVPQYIPMAFFYSLPENGNITRSDILESSLSKVLSFYYPFAGQIKDDNTYVDCDDTGVEYLNVQVSCPMSEILNHPYNDVVEVVFPQDLPWSDPSNRSLLVVQLSEFDCGGIAVSVCLSHRIADGYSVGKFFKDWASTARDDDLDFKPSPHFDGASFFPLTNDPPVITSPNTGDQPQRNVSRMYHLSSSNLDKLKVEATNSGVVQNPTRIEVATALVHKCVTSELGVSKPTVLVHVMNLRPPIPLNTIGNCLTIFTAMTATKDEINLPNLVLQLRKAKQQLRQELKHMSTNEIGARALEKVDYGPADLKEWDIDIYLYSSICHFELDAIDFGWGRPVRVTLMTSPMKNYVIFMDEPNGDGMNVLITMTEADMLVFQSNKELLQFASPIGEQVKIKDTTSVITVFYFQIF